MVVENLFIPGERAARSGRLHQMVNISDNIISLWKNTRRVAAGSSAVVYNR
jgi:hypothetical protein